MINENQEPMHHNNNVFGIFIGMLIGGLAGALTMLLFAPQSGENTRAQIQEKSIELRDRTNGMVEEAIAQVRLDRNKFTISGRRKAQELFHQGQTLVADQLEQVSEAALAGKKAIENS